MKVDGALQADPKIGIYAKRRKCRFLVISCMRCILTHGVMCMSAVLNDLQSMIAIAQRIGKTDIRH